MKSLGSQQVIRETFVDGRKTKKWRETRVVYRKACGTYWVNDGGSKSQVELIDGEFHWSTNISSLRMEKEGLPIPGKGSVVAQVARTISEGEQRRTEEAGLPCPVRFVDPDAQFAELIPEFQDSGWRLINNECLSDENPANFILTNGESLIVGLTTGMQDGSISGTVVFLETDGPQKSFTYTASGGPIRGTRMDDRMRNANEAWLKAVGPKLRKWMAYEA